ncbi:placenta-specific gene 8 protein-like [Mercenaria mercenaria]|uniref:placenta-specific gene 8 protein-like n=1 Tax=Mercenaria mercenaria TaxID=6596 RepID=UPI001E1D64F9|nr:placenta-specific gene 8 protein-like [Mercenaria mercenaria]XP_045160080.1 placenta-specific gene 8 protein-like [Mercenaria mercenaria]XP_045160081.1 placenta-specific gene 8 protein-like [Mercenaria mercenaria]
MSDPPPDYENDKPQSQPHGQKVGPEPQPYEQGGPQQQPYEQGGPQPQPYGQRGPQPQPYGQMNPQQQYGQHPQPMVMHPQQHTSTTVIVQQPTAIQNDRILGHKDGHRDWSSGLFSCFDDVGKCMWTLCCPNCVLADISARLGECAFVTCCVPGGIATIRTRVRTLGGIRGSICKDYIATECCQLCVMCQIQRELEYMGL